ncbi:MAG: hypothetical protein AAF138_07670 [Planctomycetota bacterium]
MTHRIPHVLAALGAASALIGCSSTIASQSPPPRYTAPAVGLASAQQDRGSHVQSHSAPPMITGIDRPSETGGVSENAFDLYQTGSPDVSGSIRLAADGRNQPQQRRADAFGMYSDAMLGVLPSSGAGGIPTETANISQETFTNVGSDFDPEVSHDGAFVVFASTQHNPSADIYVKRSGRNVRTQLTQDAAHDVMPSISPDNRRIAFTSNRNGNWDIFVIDRDGGKPLQITSDAAHELHPSWSPDGRSLVFSRLGRASGRWELWVVDADTPAASHFIGYGLFPEWSPIAGSGVNGTDQILFQRSRERGERAFGIWTIDYADGQAHRPTLIADSADNALINPTWSPDGRFVVYASVPNPSRWTPGRYARPAESELWMVDTDGVTHVSLTRGEAVDLMPTWAPNGKLFFVSNRAGNETLWSMDTGPAVVAAAGSLRPENSATVAAPTDNE